jgi:hypothetical protein
LRVQHFLIAFAAFLSFQTSSVLGQTAGAPLSRAAIINSTRLLGDERGQNGIVAYAAIIENVNREFIPAQNELAQIGIRLAAMSSEIEKIKSQDPNSPDLKAKLNQFDVINRQRMEKIESAQTAHGRRLQLLMRPVQQRVSEALKVFLSARGYSEVHDVANMTASQIPAGTTDETLNFISWYNALPKN